MWWSTGQACRRRLELVQHECPVDQLLGLGFEGLGVAPDDAEGLPGDLALAVRVPIE
jgi:hypothetical protein